MGRRARVPAGGEVRSRPRGGDHRGERGPTAGPRGGARPARRGPAVPSPRGSPRTRPRAGRRRAASADRRRATPPRTAHASRRRGGGGRADPAEPFSSAFASASATARIGACFWAGSQPSRSPTASRRSVAAIAQWAGGSRGDALAAARAWKARTHQIAAKTNFTGRACYSRSPSPREIGGEARELAPSRAAAAGAHTNRGLKVRIDLPVDCVRLISRNSRRGLYRGHATVCP
jgi:hypothetical protein